MPICNAFSIRSVHHIKSVAILVDLCIDTATHNGASTVSRNAIPRSGFCGEAKFNNGP